MKDYMLMYLDTNEKEIVYKNEDIFNKLEKFLRS